MKFTKIPALVSLGLAGALALTACGGGSSTPKSAPAYSEISQKANDNAKKATAATFRMDNSKSSLGEGTLTMRANFEDPVAFDMKVEGTKDGKPLNVEAISVDGAMFFKGGDSIPTSALGPELAKEIENKYLKAPANQGAPVDPTKMREQMLSEMPKADDVEGSGEVVKFEGQDAYSYKDKKDQKIFISADGSDQYIGLEEPAKDGK